jgi:hypothetical protein
LILTPRAVRSAALRLRRRGPPGRGAGARGVRGVRVAEPRRDAEPGRLPRAAAGGSHRVGTLTSYWKEEGLGTVPKYRRTKSKVNVHLNLLCGPNGAAWPSGSAGNLDRTPELGPRSGPTLRGFCSAGLRGGRRPEERGGGVRADGGGGARAGCRRAPGGTLTVMMSSRHHCHEVVASSLS